MHNLIWLFLINILISYQQTPNPFSGEDERSGYLPINRADLNMFYWLTRHRDPSIQNAPLIIWLEGGPGGSGVANMLFGMGPWTLLPNQTLNSNLLSWNSMADILIVD